MNFKRIPRNITLLNGRETDSKTFPYPQFRVYVVDEEGSKDAHLHVNSTQEDFDVILTIDGDLLSVKRHGKRKRGDKFVDVVKAAKLWLKAEPASPKVKVYYNTNQQLAEDMWEVSNP